MRQGQQNRRGRGRNNNNNNNNRKGQNPLTRSFESNGPDMKIRGTPAHIAEKYISLARDAHSAGDPVLAENYLQHAEHYNRIILAYRDQQLSQGGGDMNGVARPRPAQLHDAMDGDDFGDEDGNADLGEMPQPVVRMNEPQPHVGRNFDGQPRMDERPQRHGYEQGGQQRPHRERGERSDFRGERHGGDRDRQHGERHMGERHMGDRQMGDRQSGERQGGEGRYNDRPREPRMGHDRQPHVERSHPDRSHGEQPVVERGLGAEGGDAPAAGPSSRGEQMPRRRERFSQSAQEQPEFLRRPVRRPRREGSAGGDGDVPAIAPATANDDSNRE